MYIGKWALLLVVFWLLLSGYLQPLLLSFGAISIGIVLIVLKRMDAIDNEPRVINFGLRMVRYLAWLVGQILTSSLHVTKLVWTSSNTISPALEKIPANTVPDNTQVLYANSITLTPGTLCVDLEDDELTVHALQATSIDELNQGYMNSRISDVWSTKP